MSILLVLVLKYKHPKIITLLQKVFPEINFTNTHPNIVIERAQRILVCKFYQ